jgi:acyl-CoA thioester hydrolase
LEYLKRASMKFLYTIWDEEREKALVEGYTIHACTNKMGKIVRIPSFILDRVNEQMEIKF